MLFKGHSSRLEMVIEKIQSTKEHTEAPVPENRTGQQSSPSSSSEQASPASSCQSSAGSEHADADEPFTMGATATTPYECNICKRAFARSSVLSKHVQTHTEQLKYSCNYCPRLFKHKRSRDRHVKLHTGDKNYKCQLCTGAFSRSDHLKIHLKSHDVNKPHRCDICNRGFTSTSALATHLQKHGKKNIRCSSSASRTSAASSPSPVQSNSAIMNHRNIVTHSQTTGSYVPEATLPNVFKTTLELPKIACMYCAKDFISMNHMYQHIHTEHSSILNVLPQSIPTNLSYTPLPSPNMSPKHGRQSAIPSYPCDRCTMRFDSILSLKEHTDNVHWRPMLQLRAEYPYDNQTPSDKTQNTQSKPTDLSHKRKSEDSIDKLPEKRKADEPNVSKQASPCSTGSPYDANDRPCICSYCYAQMPNFKSFLIHMESHVSANPVALQNASAQFIGFCPICGEPGRDPIELSNHIFAHAVTNVAGKCCLQCKKSFEHVDHLQKHLLESHSQVLYKCNICNETFESQVNIQMHFKNKHILDCHHYRCNLCPDQTFHERISAEVHVNMKHSIQIPGMSRNHQQPMLPTNFSSAFQDLDSRLIYGSFQCPFCQKTFKDEYLQYLHILKEHSDAREADNYLMEISALGQRHLPPRSPSFPYTKTMTPPETHGKQDLKINGYTCDMCPRNDLATEAELLAHKKLHHTKSKGGPVSLQCAYCSEHCKSRSDLENHMKTHQVSCGKGKHKCNICDEIYTSAITLADHKLTHCKIVSGNSCTQCKTVILDEQSYYSHQLQHSNATGVNKSNSQIPLPANCVVCCQTLQTEVELKLHAKFHLRHILQKEFLCGVCNSIYDTSTGLKVKPNPEKSNSNIPVSFCKDCLANNASSAQQNHDGKGADKTKSKQYACLQCPQTFTNEEDIQAHASIHILNDGVNLECHLCRNILPSPSKLQAHLIEHNFVGIGQFNCYICSSVFTTATGLQNHIVSHGLNNRVYECNECQMKFFFCTELENHKFSHALSNQYAAKNGESESYENAKMAKKYTNCEYCSSSIEDTLYKEHIEICSKTKIKLEVNSSPEPKTNEGQTCQDTMNSFVEIKQEEIQP